MFVVVVIEQNLVADGQLGTVAAAAAVARIAGAVRKASQRGKHRILEGVWQVRQLAPALAAAAVGAAVAATVVAARKD